MNIINDNVEKVKEDISILLKKLKEIDNSLDIEFDYESITSDDYYEIKTQNGIENIYCFLYYDIDEHVLYKILIPKQYIDIN